MVTTTILVRSKQENTRTGEVLSSTTSHIKVLGQTTPSEYAEFMRHAAGEDVLREGAELSTWVGDIYTSHHYSIESVRETQPGDFPFGDDD